MAEQSDCQRTMSDATTQCHTITPDNDATHSHSDSSPRAQFHCHSQSESGSGSASSHLFPLDSDLTRSNIELCGQRATFTTRSLVAPRIQIADETTGIAMKKMREVAEMMEDKKRMENGQPSLLDLNLVDVSLISDDTQRQYWSWHQ